MLYGMTIVDGSMGGSMGGGMDPSGMGGDQGNIISQLVAKLPAPAQVLVQILLVVAAAAIVGCIIGKLYAMVRYPDPEKQQIISPKLKVLFICILAACCVWLYTIMTHEETPPLADPGTGEGQMSEVPEGESLPSESEPVPSEGEDLPKDDALPVDVADGSAAAVKA